jgi:hypothetical protein
MPATKGGPGLTPDGTENREALTALGWTRRRADRPIRSGEWRSHAAAAREASESLCLGIAKPAAKADDRAPLAAALNLSIMTFLKGQEAQLAAAVKAAEGPALISWQHEAIPEIATPATEWTASPECGRAIASISSGCSISLPTGGGALCRRRSFCWPATPRSRSV